MEMLLLLFLFGAIGFVTQFILCRKVSSLPIRLIPCFLILAGAVCSGLLALGVFGTYSAGMLGNGHLLLAMLFLLLLAAAAIGSAAAWVLTRFLPGTRS